MSSKVPSELKYAKSHEWVRIDGDIATVGITDHAQHELTDVVFVELPAVGRKLAAGEKLVLASHNKGKLKEIEALLTPFGIAVVSAGALGLPEPDETAPDFVGNARIKALAAATATGMPASLPMAWAPTTPVEGPERTVRTGRRAAASKPMTPPLDCVRCGAERTPRSLRRLAKRSM